MNDRSAGDTLATPTRTLSGLLDDLRENCTTRRLDVVLCLLEVAHRLLVTRKQWFSHADLTEIRSCMRAAEVSARSQLWLDPTPSGATPTTPATTGIRTGTTTPAIARPHVVVLHRWRDSYALYGDYLDHEATAVSYITTMRGADSVPPSAAGVVVVEATDDVAAVGTALTSLAARFGLPQRLVALNEGDLDTAAQARELLGLPGQRPPDQALFRDKLLMVERMTAAGVRVPASDDAPTHAAVARFAAAHGWPLIVKPRRGTASRGVTRLDGPDDLDRLTALGTEAHLVQTYLPEPILHIDGLWMGSRLGAWRASRYINTCAAFGDGTYLGSVEVDDADLLAAVEAFTAQVAAGFSQDPWVFHLEAFAGRDAAGVHRLTFLEVGSRVGGAEIPFIWREVHEADLMRAAVDVQLGRPPTLPVPARGEVGGYLLLPAPAPTPCRITVSRWRRDRPQHGPYAEVVHEAGTLIPKVGGYEHIGARFRFRGPSSAAVEAAVRATAQGFHLDGVSAPSAEPPGGSSHERLHPPEGSVA